MYYIWIHLDEKWKPIIHPSIRKDTYLISNWGRVVNRKRNKFVKQQKAFTKDKKLKDSENVYLRVCLNTKHNKSKMFLVHRLVAIHFIPNDDLTNKTDVNHLDGDKTMNYYMNLEWCTKKENLQHAVRTGLHYQLKGEYNKSSTFKEIHIRTICEEIERGERVVNIAKKLIKKFPALLDKHSRKNILGQIQKIKSKSRWCDIVKQYNF